MATVRIHLDKRTKKIGDLYPIKIRVMHRGEKRYFCVYADRINPLLTNELEQFRYKGAKNYSLTESFFQEITEAKRGNKKLFQEILKSYELKCQKLADQVKPFSFEQFKNLYSDSQAGANNVFVQIQKKIDRLKNEDRYNTVMKSLQLFTGKKRLAFETIVPGFLVKYQKWMQANEKSDTTTGIYLRHLRSVFNDAIALHITENYPFHSKQNRLGYKIPQPKGRKLALTTKELKAIFSKELEADNPGRFYTDMWKLMYLMQGINPKDLCLLKYKNIGNGVLSFTRQKTKNARATKIEIPVNNEIQKYISRWGNLPEPDNFIFPILKTNDTLKQTKQIAQFVKSVNKYIDRMVLGLGIYKNVTCYTARHSYATQLMRHGAPVAFISKSLGHSSTGTTDRYLDSFEDEQIKKWQDKITQF